jgi:hypothetical protein
MCPVNNNNNDNNSDDENAKVNFFFLPLYFFTWLKRCQGNDFVRQISEDWIFSRMTS